MSDNNVLNKEYESLVVYDTECKKELVRITKDEIVISNSNLLIKLKPTQS